MKSILAPLTAQNMVVCIVAASRLVFAIARDGVLPGSSWIGKVGPDGVPRNATTFIGGIAFVLLCIVLANVTAFNSLISCGAVPTIAACASPPCRYADAARRSHRATAHHQQDGHLARRLVDRPVVQAPPLGHRAVVRLHHGHAPQPGRVPRHRRVAPQLGSGRPRDRDPHRASTASENGSRVQAVGAYLATPESRWLSKRQVEEINAEAAGHPMVGADDVKA